MDFSSLSKTVMKEIGAVSRLFWKNSLKQGQAPGALVHVGERLQQQPRITVFDYTEDTVDENTVADAEACFAYRDTESVTWINVDGVHDTDLVEKLGTHFGLHPLVMEDIVNTGQRPKAENYGDYIYLVFKMLRFDPTRQTVMSEQVSLILGKNIVLSFQEQQGDVFNPLRDRIRQGVGRVRRCGADYLAYGLADAIIDGYFSLLETMGEIIETLDAAVMTDPSPQTPQVLQHLRTEAMVLRKAVWPLRESVGELRQMETPLMTKMLVPYLADLYDHAVHVADSAETLRELIASLRDTYLTTISNRTNEVMKVLTILATIFIPLTFVAGIYGMNFEIMPELKWRYGYAYALGLMLLIACGMVVYFRRKRWL